jgi:predicted HicB family RNase H-like nuclease
MFEYKGYTGAIDTADTDTGWFTGSIIGIQDVVTFEGKTVPALEKAFRDSVDDYLEFCKELKEAPERPFSGKFVVRLSPELHRSVSEAARQEQMSLNAWVIAAVEQRLHQPNSDAHSMPFEEMERLAQCVAAILAEKNARPANGAKNTKQRRKPVRTKASALN